MAKINGRVVELSFGSTPVRICGGQSISLSVDVDLPDATNQCSAGWEEQIHGTRSWSVDFDGVYDTTFDINADALIGAIIKESPLELTCEISTETFTGNCKVSSVSITADMESPVGYSFTVEGHGKILHT
jgi:predicted secreted protein